MHTQVENGTRIFVLLVNNVDTKFGKFCSVLSYFFSKETGVCLMYSVSICASCKLLFQILLIVCFHLFVCFDLRALARILNMGIYDCEII